MLGLDTFLCIFNNGITMKKILRFSLVIGQTLFLQAAVVTPISAQTSTSSSTSTSSALPEAGNFSTTIYILLFGLSFLVVGAFLLLKQAKQRA